MGVTAFTHIIKHNKNHPSPEIDPVHFWTLIGVHAFHIIPIIFAWYKNLPDVYILILSLQLAFSLIYHSNHHSNKLRVLDWSFSSLLIIFNTYILFTFTQGALLFYKLAILVPLAGIAFYFLFSKKYKTHHTLWHLISILITLGVMY